ncbi:MAG: septum formation inhibitor Maf [Candidatus Tectomicrobia bacterium]|uniref:dTTP/UTP pyrophosphatase n=1 Tax=Tectimicrobiota bacterium TaxID=2528274 RepID=A0A932FZQ0_UNCTE|nr:septum formation inhibitor Maf [Candidatus Tectomicrobia bacterium]
MPLILASASPRRKELLKQIGVECWVVPSEIEEEQLPGEDPVRYALRLATDKAREVAGRYPSRLVLGADTIVLLDQAILEKPLTRPRARQMLRQLSGRENVVITAFALVLQERDLLIRRWVETRVKMKALTEREIEGYLDTGEPLDKAGAYGIQGKGVLLVESIQGCYTNVVGLPLPALAEALGEIGIALW